MRTDGNDTEDVVAIGDGPLSLDSLTRAARGEVRIVLADEAVERMRSSRRLLLAAIERGDSIYGSTTAVAERKRVAVGLNRQVEFNRLLVAGHRCAQGPPASPFVTRATMLCLANSLARGLSGVRPETAERLLRRLADDVPPRVGTLGSLGEADIGALADLVTELLAEGAFELEAGEGLALMNSNALATGWTAMALHQAETLLGSAELALALDLEAFRANLDAWHPMVVTCRPLEGVQVSVGRVREQLTGSSLWEQGRARNLQDPMSFRCAPQVHGAAREAFSYACSVVETEINAVHSNPITVEAEDRLVSLGNFDAIALSAAADFARIALAPVISSASERSVKLLQEPTSGLAAGLAQDPSLGDDALAELAVSSQSFAVEARMLAQPVSFEPASSYIAEGIEDRATMAPLSARRLEDMVSLGARVVAAELVVAAQAVDLRGDDLGEATAATYAFVRHHVPFVKAGEGLPYPLEDLVAAVEHGELLDANPLTSQR